jgi:hypothetical protein
VHFAQDSLNPALKNKDFVYYLQFLKDDGVQNRGVKSFCDPISSISEAKVKEELKERPSRLNLGPDSFIDL